MKLKLPTGSSGIKTLLANHVEKIVFGVMALVSLLIIMSGFGKRTVIEATRTPQHLKSENDQALSHINSFSWDSDFRSERDRQQKYLERVNSMSVPVQPESYAVKQLIKPPYVPPRALRRDPELLAVEDLRAVAGSGFLSLKNTNAVAGGTMSTPVGFQERSRNGVMAVPEDSFIATDGDALAKAVYFVGVTGIVPWKQQIQLYFDALGDSDEFRLDRDQPKVVGYILERAEVVGGDLAAAKWVRVGTSTDVARAKDAEWMGSVSPPSPWPYGNFVHETLTSPLPPIRGAGGLKFWSNLANHPKLPTAEEMERRRTEEATMATQTGPGTGDPLNAFAPPPGLGTGTQPHSATSGTPEATATLTPRQQFLKDAPDYYLFRHVDYTAEPGKTYAYRVVLYVNDPNNPQTEKPSIASLEADVANRVTANPAAWYRMTEPSEPTPPVRIPAGDQVLAGEMTVPEGIPMRGVPGQTYRTARQEPSVKVVGIEFDRRLAVEKSILVDAYRGTVLNGKEQVQVELPLQSRRGTMPEEVVATNAVVLDMAGGETIGSTSLKAPSRVLVWSSDGSFGVAHELSSLQEFPSYMPPVEEPAAATPGPAAETEEPRRGRAGGAEGARGLGFGEGEGDTTSPRPGNRRQRNRSTDR
jgi:hypothetical protein